MFKTHTHTVLYTQQHGRSSDISLIIETHFCGKTDLGMTEIHQLKLHDKQARSNERKKERKKERRKKGRKKEIKRER
jgi:hypothetical protein